MMFDSVLPRAPLLTSFSDYSCVYQVVNKIIIILLLKLLKDVGLFVFVA
jgi:hypothetical protein